MEQFETRLKDVYATLERYVKYRLNGGSDAEDLLQEICLTAYQKYSQLKKKDAFKSWVLSIARNECNDYFRRKGKIQEVPIEEVPESVLSFGRQGLTVQCIVEDTLQTLSERDRQILDLYFWQELPQMEIAQRLGVPVGTVKSRLHHAKNRFKDRYPYPPQQSKGEKTMEKLPKTMPEYSIVKMEADPFTCKWEELQGWLIVPRLGEKLSWGMYDFPERSCTQYTDMEVVGRAEVHGIEGVEIVAKEHGAGDFRDPGFEDNREWRFVAQLTETHSRYLAESHMENGIRKFHTFLDGDEFLNNWGFGENNCGTEVNLVPRGLLKREQDVVTAPSSLETMDVVGRYAVTIQGRTYDTICVMDVELYNDAVATEQFVDRNGRTVLWRRFNRDDWAVDRLGKRWSEKFPENERLTINGETYVHWYDCISDYIL